MDLKQKTAVGRRFDESEAQAKLSRIVSENFSPCDIKIQGQQMEVEYATT